MILEPYDQWSGTIDELAKAAVEVLVKLGRSDGQPLNARLIRDYAQRGIVSPSERRGKEAFYHLGHLQELVAARILIGEGVPLAKIAEQFQRDRDMVMITLGLTAREGSAENPARARWKQLAAGRPARAQQTASLGDFIEEEPVGSVFMRKAFEDTGQREDMRQRLTRLGVDRPAPQVDRLVRLKITDWCELHIDAQRLRTLTTEEAEDIGRTISTALVDPHTKKGE
jgi:DNA-binding transcriptional MerR regulator